MPVAFARSMLRRLRRRPRHELRRDPRTDHLASLRNLLRLRGEANGWDSVAVGTSDQVLLATSGEARSGESVLVRAHEAVQRGRIEPASLSFAVGNQILVLAADGPASTPALMEIAQRARCILRERDVLAR
jgi:hypothetical protein